MNDFWTNVLRYPRFFVSSVFGLVFIILTPFKNFFKNPIQRVFLFGFLFLFLLSLYNILLQMIGF